MAGGRHGDKKLFGGRGRLGEIDRGHRGPNVDLLSLSFSFTKQGCMVTISLERLSLEKDRRERGPARNKSIEKLFS
jgi:hypothetical protein